MVLRSGAPPPAEAVLDSELVNEFGRVGGLPLDWRKLAFGSLAAGQQVVDCFDEY